MLKIRKNCLLIVNRIGVQELAIEPNDDYFGEKRQIKVLIHNALPVLPPSPSPVPPPSPSKTTNLTWLWITIGIVVVLCIGLVGYVLYRRRNLYNKLGMDELKDCLNEGDNKKVEV